MKSYSYKTVETPMMPTRPPMPPVQPPCKHRITLKCDQDDLWGIFISDTLVCYAKTHEELMHKLSNLLNILD